MSFLFALFTLIFMPRSTIILVLSFMFLWSTYLLSEYFTFLFSSPHLMGSSMGSLLVTLSLLIFLLVFLSTHEEKSRFYDFSITSLLLVLVLTFTTSNILLFYIFFFFSLIPTMYLILTFGYQPERIQAALYMLLYTVSASLPLLLLVLWMVLSSGSASLGVFTLWNYESSNTFMSLMLLAAFLVKLPIYSMHLWLPKAHVEAPLGGSMILAGILLKLGGYGLYLMSNYFSYLLTPLCIIFTVSLAVWGGMLSAFVCLCQSDMKALVAYSSVVHMCLTVGGILLDSKWGILTAKISMFAHGFTSSALFVMAGLSYQKSSSRSFFLNKGMLSLFPTLAFFWFLFTCLNSAVPPSLNFMGELFIFPTALNWGVPLLVIFMSLMFFSLAYNMYLYSSVNHGAGSNMMIAGTPIKSLSYLSLSLHMSPCLILFSFSNFF